MRTRNALTLLASATALLLGSTPVVAAPSDPVYPLPGGPGDGHGGSSCYALTDAEAAMGKTAVQNGTPTDGQTWFYGGGTATPQTGPGCAFSATAATDAVDFDTSRFERLFWGVSMQPRLALDGTIDAATETLTLDSATNLAGGLVVWTGATTMTWCHPSSCAAFTTSSVPTRVELRVADHEGQPASLLDPATVDVADSQVGGLVEVTALKPRFSANIRFLAADPGAGGTMKPAISMYNSYNHPNVAGPRTQMSFGAGFRFVSRAPVGTIEGDPLHGVPTTLTAAATDPDGAAGDVLTYAWDLDDDGEHDDGSAETAQVTFQPGAHDVSVLVTDPDGAVGTLSRTFTVVDAVDPQVSLALKSARIGALLKNGLKGTLTSDEAGSSTLKATISQKLARKLKLTNPVAKGRIAEVGAGSNAFSLSFTKAAKRKLKTLGKLPIKVTAVTQDLAGNATTSSKSRTYQK